MTVESAPESNPPRFDLLNDPWIPVIYHDTGSTASSGSQLEPRARELSLRAVFRDAPQVLTLSGEIPTQTFAILRLLLAILRRSIRDRSGRPTDVWKSLWTDDALPLAEIDQYLDDHKTRFNLFDPVAPFFQVADLRINKGASTLDVLIADVPNGHKYFTSRGGRHMEAITFAEAARWLVHAQAFDPSGIKSGADGDPRAKGGRGYPIGVAWTGQLGGIYWEGANLAETLILNTALAGLDDNPYPKEDKPAWERPPAGPTVRLDPEPSGPADLFTWQSRRIRLVAEEKAVTGVVLCNGDPLEPFNKQRFEPMTAWRFSQVQTKKSGRDRHYPLTHHVERGLWRSLASLLSQGQSKNDRGAPVQPGLVQWASRLVEDGKLDVTQLIRLHATGMEYVNNQAVVGEVVDDSLTFRVALLSSDPHLRMCALDAIKTAENSVGILASLAGDLALAAGGEPTLARSHARERGYFILESSYRRWLAGLASAADVELYDRNWQEAVRREVVRIARELIDTAGTPARVGRRIGDRYMDAARAEGRFFYLLRSALPAAFHRPVLGKEEKQ
ncbi:type I-E CRISPR-associated protein Cse1/CasA [Nocardia brasiliensis]|uniref:Type I-E CRISPR-associated protein Cse1/CasA n=1 Tax=Nocardia brasiliensis TaxID=37326 RepID=A0A6G9XXB7_NOCBR|nr:type I-E CRISPR-associated protein Cse1/CasA [Nocardia brasiliensis]QIS05589.1 type I-E CRISPR-associated protein Cse1/CasA [Nocardia brasiliensis]